jgi:hypothetical protein
VTVGPKLDVIEVLLHYGIDVHPGRHEQLALCISHSESKPSMSVNSDKGVVNCHACEFSGDGWHIIMLKEGIGYAAALEFAEKVFGAVPGLPAGGGRKGLSGKPRPARGGYRPAFRKRPGLTRPD